jgi:5-amino-6-(5-phosphoribosylamino)uracil reductase
VAVHGAAGARPYVLLSAAMSADGYLDDASGTRLVLSDAADLDRVDELRARSDAILVGAQTIRADDPGLLVKAAARRRERATRGAPASPLKVTVTGHGNLDPGSRFFAEADGPPLVYAVAAAADTLRVRLGVAGRVVPVPALMGLPDRLDLAWVVADLAARGVGRLMVEGGAQVLAQFLAGDLADEFLLAIAPVFVADPAAPRLLAGARPAGRLRLASVTQAGDMAVLRYLPTGPASSPRAG